MPLRVNQLNLTQFRCYDALRLDITGAQAVVFTGENGAGKTNILEAVSLLTPGRGLRGASLDDMRNKNAGAMDMWAVAADIMTPQGLRMKIGTGESRGLGGKNITKKRSVRINGKDAKNQTALAEYVAAVWLTPQMDRLFIEGPAARRKFLDRLTLSLHPDHATHLNRYEKNLRQRMKVFQGEINPDGRWLDALETKIAEDGVAVAAARFDMLLHLEKHMKAGDGVFPAPVLSLNGWIDDALQSSDALAVEQEMKSRLANNRRLDAALGRTETGPHRSDFAAIYAEKNMPADQCSTGEQKGLLVSIILAHALMMKGEKGYAPLILFDEVAAHLDESRRAELFHRLLATDAQVWLTGTEEEIFKSVTQEALFFTVAQNRVSRPEMAKVRA